MRIRPSIICVAALALAAGAGPLRAAEETNSPARSKPNELREQIKNLTPEERAARLKALRERNDLPRDEAERRREMLRQLSPEERELKLKEWRERAGAERQSEERKKRIREEREAKQKEVRQRLEQQLEGLRRKEADGSISPEEHARLQRLEKIYRRFEERGPLPDDGSAPPAKEPAEDHRTPNSPP